MKLKYSFCCTDEGKRLILINDGEDWFMFEKKKNILDFLKSNGVSEKEKIFAIRYINKVFRLKR